MSGGSSLCCGGCSDKGAECAAFAAGRCGHRPLQSSKNRTSFDFHTSNIYRTAIYECRNCYARPKGVRTMVGITITRTTERLVFQARKRYSLPQRLFSPLSFLARQKRMSRRRHPVPSAHPKWARGAKPAPFRRKQNGDSPFGLPPFFYSRSRDKSRFPAARAVFFAVQGRRHRTAAVRSSPVSPPQPRMPEASSRGERPL